VILSILRETIFLPSRLLVFWSDHVDNY